MEINPQLRSGQISIGWPVAILCYDYQKERIFSGWNCNSLKKEKRQKGAIL